MLAFGGGAGVIPDMQRAAVDQLPLADRAASSWTCSRSPAPRPGPGSLIVVLIGLKAAGLAGAAVSFVAMFGPSCLAVHIIARFWQRAAASAWRAMVERALAPVAVGLTFASGLSLMRGTEHGWLPWSVTAVSAAAVRCDRDQPDPAAGGRAPASCCLLDREANTVYDNRRLPGCIMSFALGIGIVTYNRRDIVGDTIDRVRAFTRRPDAAFVVADDGCTDGTLEMLRQKQVPGHHRYQHGHCVEQKPGAVCVVANAGMRDDRAAGGRHPARRRRVGGCLDQCGPTLGPCRTSRRPGCASISSPAPAPRRIRCAPMLSPRSAPPIRATALTYGGYFDPRFRGYGHEHVEHTRRLIRVGYGGTDEMIEGQERVRYFLIESDLKLVETKSYLNSAEEERNLHLARSIMGQQGYRSPWGEDRELRQFRSETESAMSGGIERFRLTPAEQPTTGSDRVFRPASGTGLAHASRVTAAG